MVGGLIWLHAQRPAAWAHAHKSSLWTFLLHTQGPHAHAAQLRCSRLASLDRTRNWMTLPVVGILIELHTQRPAAIAHAYLKEKLYPQAPSQCNLIDTISPQR